MKKLLYLGFLGLLLIGCQGEETPELPGNESVTANAQVNLVEICHYDSVNDEYFTIAINENAVPGHVGHGDIYDMDGDGYYPENDCGLQGDFDEFDCDDSDPLVYPGNGCEACPGYGWTEFLNSLDLSRACRSIASGSGGQVLYTNGLDGNYYNGLAVFPNGLWYTGADGNGQGGQEPPESYDCFVQFLDDNNLPTCTLLQNSPNRNDIFSSNEISASSN